MILANLQFSVILVCTFADTNQSVGLFPYPSCGELFAAEACNVGHTEKYSKCN